MSVPTIIDLGTIDIGVGGSTAPQQICYQHGWSVAPTVTGTPGTASYTVTVSQDNITYFDYKTLATNVAIEDAVDDVSFNWSWIVIEVNAGGPSAGTAQFGMEMKSI